MMDPESALRNAKALLEGGSTPTPKERAEALDSVIESASYRPHPGFIEISADQDDRAHRLLGDVVDFIVARTSDRSPTVRAMAVRGLGSWPSERSVEAAIGHLSGSASSLRLAALNAFTPSRNPSEGLARWLVEHRSDMTCSALDAVIACLLDDDAEIQIAAVRALDGFGQDWAWKALDALRNLVQSDADSSARVEGLQQLMRMGLEASTAIATIVELAAGEDEEVGAAAARALVEIDPEAESAGDYRNRIASFDRLSERLARIGEPARKLRHRLRPPTCTWSEWKEWKDWADELRRDRKTIRSYIVDGKVRGEINTAPSRHKIRIALEDLGKFE